MPCTDANFINRRIFLIKCHVDNSCSPFKAELTTIFLATKSVTGVLDALLLIHCGLCHNIYGLPPECRVHHHVHRYQVRHRRVWRDVGRRLAAPLVCAAPL